MILRKTCDTASFGKYFNLMLEKGIYLAPSQFESLFISTKIDKKTHQENIEGRILRSLKEIKTQK